MVKAVVLWERAPDSDWYGRHGELCAKVPGVTFRAGRIFGSPAGKPDRQQYAEDDPRHHTAKLKSMLSDTIEHARDDVTKIADPRAKALFETTAEVLGGMITAYEHYEQKAEPAWR